MSLIGMYHFRKDPNKVGRAYQYAAIASLEGLEFFYFTAKRVDFDKKLIKGLVYKNEEWIEKEFPFPDCIINQVGPITQKEKETYYKLKNEVHFTSFPVGTKLSVYNRIKKGNVFKDFLIPYKLLKKPMDVLEFLQDNQKIILKPISGHHGNKIVFIESFEDYFKINDGGNLYTYTKMDLYQYLSELRKTNKMIIQKYIPCRTIEGDPFDIRLHLQKDGNGKWVNTIIYPKIGIRKRIATNLGQGGQITILKNFLKNIYKEEYFDVMKYLEVFAIQFANHFDTLYNNKFDELGIDVGLDENKKIWIYEVNWRPGQIFLESKASKLEVRYANFLGKRGKEK